MSKKDKKKDKLKAVPRNVVAYEMILSGKGTIIMRDRRERRKGDARHSFQREEW